MLLQWGLKWIKRPSFRFPFIKRSHVNQVCMYTVPASHSFYVPTYENEHLFVLIIIFWRWFSPFILMLPYYLYLLSLWWCCVLTSCIKFQPQLWIEKNKCGILKHTNRPPVNGMNWKQIVYVLMQYIVYAFMPKISAFSIAQQRTQWFSCRHRYLIFPLTPEMKKTHYKMRVLTDVQTILYVAFKH